jgi:hypothetical protein
MARAKKLRSRFASKSRQAQLKVRLPEPLRFSLEREAASRGHSMNTEIVRRLRESFGAQQKTPKLIAEAVLEGLDDEVVSEIADTLKQWEADDWAADTHDEFRERLEDSK